MKILYVFWSSYLHMKDDDTLAMLIKLWPWCWYFDHDDDILTVRILWLWWWHIVHDNVLAMILHYCWQFGKDVNHVLIMKMTFWDWSWYFFYLKCEWIKKDAQLCSNWLTGWQNATSQPIKSFENIKVSPKSIWKQSCTSFFIHSWSE